MRAIVTGQVGMDKRSYFDKVVNLAGNRGENVQLFNVGDMMYAEGRDIPKGRILDLPLSRLNTLRRSAFKDIIAQSKGQENIIVNTHATFRWRHGLFAAFDFDQIKELEIDTLIVLVDNIEVVYDRLHADHTIDATLKDLMVWREEEIMATELLAQALGLGNNFYVLSRGRHEETIETGFKLICRPQLRTVYPSFPMTHVVGMPDVLEEIDAFRAELAKHFITFDPGDVDEKLLLDQAIAAAKEGKDFIETEAHSFSGSASQVRVSVKQVLDIAGDIDGQIYARDFKLIDQSDIIVSLVPELPDGMPGLSSGVERELQHAFEHGKEVYVVWKPEIKQPSPFITETATKVFKTTDEALTYFEEQGMFAETNLFGH
ncbi:AAA family ATPase [Poriferisphaera sp. WC338]|uniref:AAA family ATPase n=1 Tax=Poriferisphaera sp. WC338 TaxID=3425129 RepID=UPI003D81817D